jgi:glycosyltransferase involved in cell wall biosynthesis
VRILHIYKNYAPIVGGIENHLRLVAERQAAAGHDVTVLVCSQDRHTRVETLNGVRVLKAARLAEVASTPLSLRLPLLLARERPDIAHLHFPYPPGEVAQLLVGRSRRMVVSYHSNIVRQRRLLQVYGPILKRFLARADRILVATPNTLASSPVLAPARNKCEVLPYGIDRRPFLEADRAAVLALRGRLGGGPLVLFVGVLRYYKGLRYLIEAMRAVAARLVIVGAGPVEGELRAQVDALRLRERVTFAGRATDAELPLYYHAADLFVLPASERSEAFGLVQVEAMSAGLPVICTELGTGTSYVNQHGASGLVVPPRDAAALAGAINAVLGDPALRARLAQGALARSALFSVERMMADLDQVYAELAP